MKNERKTTVLEFKKERLVNLNDEEMFKVKGGNSTRVCTKTIREIWKICKKYWPAFELLEGDDSTIEKPFKVTDNYLGSDITCASSPELIVHG